MGVRTVSLCSAPCLAQGPWECLDISFPERPKPETKQGLPHEWRQVYEAWDCASTCSSSISHLSHPDTKSLLGPGQAEAPTGLRSD